MISYYLPSLCGSIDRYCNVAVNPFCLHYCKNPFGYSIDHLCEFDFLSGKQVGGTRVSAVITLTPASHWSYNSLPVPTVKCPTGHATHVFMACDVQSLCWQDPTRYVHSKDRERPSASVCPAPMTSLPPMFRCDSGVQRVPYSLVCDHRRQCDDGSDESFCVFQPCAEPTPFPCPGSQQCLPTSVICDVENDCVYISEENGCDRLWLGYPKRQSVLSIDQQGFNDSMPRIEPFVLSPKHDTKLVCPETHFHCPASFCLPVFVICNDVYDCPGREDELNCEDFVCPGFYRCRGSKICLHHLFLCDDYYHCPQQDDEVFCDIKCPQDCVCHGLALQCNSTLPNQHHPDVKYLDIGGIVGADLSELENYYLLIYLGMARCELHHFHKITLRNLRQLDLSLNHLRVISAHDLSGMSNLQQLYLSGNPLESLLSADSDKHLFPAARMLDLSNVKMRSLDTRVLAMFPNLLTLNLSGAGIVQVEGSLEVVGLLDTLDLRGCPLTDFPQKMLTNLAHLQSVKSDNYKLCCATVLPQSFNYYNCIAPVDEVSSCESLLRSDVYRVALYIFSIFALMGNCACFLIRNIYFKSGKSGFGAFVTHLSFADSLMGVFLVFLGVADQLYMGNYLWKEYSWRNSVACQMAGFLSLLSSEVSAIVICLITLDRFLVLRFPFSTLHFSAKSAHLTCGAAWTSVLVIAALPFSPAMSHWSFYSQTGICVPLPILDNEYPGYSYAFGVLVVFNFILFVLTAAGQVVIYSSIQANIMESTSTTRTSNDVRIARRLITVAVSDFLCWFPVGLLGLLAAGGTSLPGEVNVSLVIFVLPLNSALNPFLYTLNVVLERRRRVRVDRLLKEMLEGINNEGI